MALREVLKFPEKRLREVSLPIAEISDEVRALADDMLEVMYNEPGIGLAAPQVGEAIRLIVTDTEWTQEGAERHPLVLVNPEIYDPEGTIVCTLTGHGLKDPDTAIRQSAGSVIEIPAESEAVKRAILDNL